MTRSEIIRSLHEEYSRLREENLREHDRRLSYVEAIDPRIADIVRSSNSLFMQQARLILSRPEEAEKMAVDIRKKASVLRSEQEGRLLSLGLATDYLDPIYHCRMCKDRGYVGDGVREMCDCMNKQLIMRLYASSRERGISKQRFETFNEGMIPNAEKVDGVYTQREITVAVKNQCQIYADSFPNTQKLGLLLMGNTGLGKTFLLNCVENRLLDREFSPISVTAYRLFETMRGTHFSDSEKRQEFDQLVSCDILLIDDLGTEPITREYLFTLLNERIVHHRHTVIATNLSMKALMDIYGERVLSRLFDMMNVAVTQLKGRDLRMIAGRSGK